MKQALSSYIVIVHKTPNKYTFRIPFPTIFINIILLKWNYPF
jgi:hypothetical protein